MFENPFALNEEKGNVIFKSCRDWGYAAFGGLLYTYLLWQDQKLDEYGIEKLLFLSRDGYLLKQIYDYWVGKNTGKKKPESDYLYASRRMAYVSTLKDEQSYREWMEFPYTGLFKDYLKIRFSVELENDELALEYVELPRDKEKVDGWLRHYQNQIRKNVEKEQQDYYEYVMKHLPEKKCAVMDMGYYGMIQCRLQELSGKELFGFYFSNYLADDNEFARKTKLIPCFQQEDNISGVGLNNRKYSQLLESIFTAPYGMVIAVDEDGNRICSNSGKNQNSFILREEIKEGIQDYLDDMIKFNDIVKLDLNNICIWADKFMGLIIGNSKTCDQIRKSFYFEEEIVKKDENTILT